MTLAGVLGDGTAAYGASVVFGLPGGGPNLDVIGACADRGLQFVLAHGETAACIMASTYGYLVGRTALAIATRGPGAASAINGAAQATLDRFPLVLVTDTVPESDAARVAHQRIDQHAAFTPVTKWSGRLGSGNAAEAVAAAFRLASSAPMGAVHLDFDPSALGDPPAPTFPPTPPSERGAWVAPLSAVDQPELGRARDLVQRSRRPVAIVGIDAIGASVALRPLLEHAGIPTLSTYQALGVVDEESPVNAGIFTNGASERALLQQADLLLAIGLDPVEPIPAAWPCPETPLLSVASRPLSDPYFVPTIELVGDIAEIVSAVADDPHNTWPPAAGRDFRDEVRRAMRSHGAGSTDRADRTDRADGMGPLEVVDKVVAAAPADATVTVDAGAHFLAIMPFWPVRHTKQLLISNGLATMGFALPAAIGAALARPGTPVLCLTGDGGLSMCLAELETVARHALPIAVVVFNDAALSLIEIKQRQGQGGTAAVRYLPTDYAAVARAMHIDGVVVRTGTELAAAFRQHRWDRPMLIDARIDPTTYRHLMKVTRG